MPSAETYLRSLQIDRQEQDRQQNSNTKQKTDYSGLISYAIQNNTKNNIDREVFIFVLLYSANHTDITVVFQSVIHLNTLRRKTKGGSEGEETKERRREKVISCFYSFCKVQERRRARKEKGGRVRDGEGGEEKRKGYL